MSKDTNIKWTESTWNPITGCSKVSAGCKNCYALRDWPRLAKNEKSIYFNRAFTDVAFHQDRLDQPIRWKKPRKIFVNSMSDLFHEDLSFDVIDKVFATMLLAPWHTYQVLTKRPEIMVDWLSTRLPLLEEKMADLSAFFTADQIKLHPELKKSTAGLINGPMSHIWLGTSVEDEKAASTRLPLLKEIKKYTKVAWVSAEPLIRPYSIEEFADSIDWFVLGGESGPNARIMQQEWVYSFVEQCRKYGVPFLFKQWGEWAPVNGIMTNVGVDNAGDLINGINYAQYPEFT